MNVDEYLERVMWRMPFQLGSELCVSQSAVASHLKQSTSSTDARH